jgi:hypothetical protein
MEGRDGGRGGKLKEGKRRKERVGRAWIGFSTTNMFPSLRLDEVP